ncbi:alpha/beta hydrolase-fold protein [Robertmurraya sp. FSL W8-0741]|uniref:alpha/beta hydrolase n=1 Tax=Robertmurraya TaxID=2837507 RepID=UPI000BA511B8|nr:alpha/beta hydrolase-fold protein [Robertmurraya siralis]PAE18850.1 hypothetical protein CHH80_19600 [Bacillus sp. 7504-2]
MQNKDIQFDYDSKFTHYQYTIEVYVPNETPPKSGFPIVYLLDGQSYFQFAKYAVKLQSANTAKTKVEPSIVVGICHDEQDMRQRRFYEFTAPAEHYLFPEHAKGKKMNLGHHGGAPLFQKFMKEELKPAIEKKFAVNKNKQTLFGHSLAGYYTIWCYLTHCHDFQTYIAISPSIWWNGKELFDYLEKANPDDLQKLFIAVGEHEGFMVEDAKEFYKELPALSKELFIASEENHASVVPATISRALRFKGGET